MYRRFQCTVTFQCTAGDGTSKSVLWWYIEIRLATVHWTMFAMVHWNSLGDGTFNLLRWYIEIRFWRRYIEICLRLYIEIRLATVHVHWNLFGDGRLKYVYTVAKRISMYRHQAYFRVYVWLATVHWNIFGHIEIRLVTVHWNHWMTVHWNFIGVL